MHSKVNHVRLAEGSIKKTLWMTLILENHLDYTSILKEIDLKKIVRLKLGSPLRVFS